MNPKFYTLPEFSVRFSETDAAGVVHFTHFLRWAENAEGDFFRTNGLRIFEKMPAGAGAAGFPRVRVSADFFAPAHYADKIRVRIRPAALPLPNSRRIDWIFEIARVEKSGEETALAAGAWTSVCAEFFADGTAHAANALPAALLRALEKTFF